jgi:hypothetical protein
MLAIAACILLHIPLDIDYPPPRSFLYLRKDGWSALKQNCRMSCNACSICYDVCIDSSMNGECNDGGTGASLDMYFCPFGTGGYLSIDPFLSCRVHLRICVSWSVPFLLSFVFAFVFACRRNSRAERTPLFFVLLLQIVMIVGRETPGTPHPNPTRNMFVSMPANSLTTENAMMVV